MPLHNTRRIILSLSLVVFSAISFSGCKANNPPLIGKLLVPSEVTYPGKGLDLSVIAVDPDGGPLTYKWIATAGDLSAANNPNTAWMPPDTPGVVDLSVIVTDKQGAATMTSARVQVMNTLLIPKETPFTLRLLRSVDGNTAHVGDKVPVAVDQDVTRNGFTVARQNDYGVAVVSEVRNSGFQGKGGAIVLTVAVVQLADGQLVPLNASLSAEGKSSSISGVTGLINVAASLLPVPARIATNLISFIITGNEGRINAGTQLVASTVEDVTMAVSRSGITPIQEPIPPPVTRKSCLGIDAESYGDITLALHNDGVKVMGFLPDSIAQATGIRTGDRIAGLTIRGTNYPVQDIATIERLLFTTEPGEPITVQIRNLLRSADVNMNVGACYEVRDTDQY